MLAVRLSPTMHARHGRGPRRHSRCGNRSCCCFRGRCEHQAVIGGAAVIVFLRHVARLKGVRLGLREFHAQPDPVPPSRYDSIPHPYLHSLSVYAPALQPSRPIIRQSGTFSPTNKRTLRSRRFRLQHGRLYSTLQKCVAERGRGARRARNVEVASAPRLFS